MNISDENLISIYLSGMLTKLTVEAITEEKKKHLNLLPKRQNQLSCRET